MKLLLKLVLTGDIKKNEFPIEIILDEDKDEDLIKDIKNVKENNNFNKNYKATLNKFVMEQLDSYLKNCKYYKYEIENLTLDNNGSSNQTELTANINAKKRKLKFKLNVKIPNTKSITIIDNTGINMSISDKLINSIDNAGRNGYTINEQKDNELYKNIVQDLKNNEKFDWNIYYINKIAVMKTFPNKNEEDELIVPVNVTTEKVNNEDKQKEKGQQKTKEDKKIQLSLNFNLIGKIKDKLNIKSTTTTENPNLINYIHSKINNENTEDSQKTEFDRFIQKCFEHNSSYAENYEYKIKDDQYKIEKCKTDSNNNKTEKYNITINVKIGKSRNKRELLLNLYLKGYIEREVTISATTNDEDIINYIECNMPGKNSINSNHDKDKFNNFIKEHLSYYVPVNYECDLNNKIKIEKLDESKISVTMDINVKKRKIDNFDNEFQTLSDELTKLQQWSVLKGSISDNTQRLLNNLNNNQQNNNDSETYKDTVTEFIKSEIKQTKVNNPFTNEDISAIVENIESIITKSESDNEKLIELTNTIINPLNDKISNEVKGLQENNSFYKNICFEISKYPRLQDLIKELKKPKSKPLGKEFDDKFNEFFTKATTTQIKDYYEKTQKENNSAKLEDQAFYKEICSKMDEIKDKIKPVLMNFRAELFKNQNRMNSVIDSIIQPIKNIDDKSENLGAFKQTMKYALKCAFLPNQRIYDNTIKKSSKSNYDEFNILNLSDVSSNQFYRASYNETHKFDTRNKDNKFYRFGVSIINFGNAYVQGVYKTDDSNKQVTDGIWIYNEDWISKFKENVKNRNIVFTNAGFIDTKESQSNDYQESAQNILGEKPAPYKIKGILNNEVNINTLLDLIIDKKKAEITQTYEANTPKRLYEILTNVNPPFEKAGSTEFLFIVLTEAECGPDRGGRAALKALREICRKIKTALEKDEDVKKLLEGLGKLKKSNEYATCNIFHEVIDKLFLFTKYGGGGMQSGINNIEDGNEQFETSFQENNKEQNIKKTNNLDNKQFKENNKKQNIKKTNNLDNKQFKEDNEDEQIINNSNKGSLWKKIGQTIFGNMKKTTLDYSHSEDENSGKGFSKK